MSNKISAEFRMISGCEDAQTSSDVSDVSSFKLPDAAGRAGGALTSTLLQILYEDEKKPDKDMSFKDLLLKIRVILSKKNFTQIPQLSSSHPMKIETKFDLSPPDCRGKKRAVLIGINYAGSSAELYGCHNDVLNMKKYIMDVHGFAEENIDLLMDDGAHTNPTKDNIIDAFKKLAGTSEPGDVVYVQFSGHGGKVKDDDKNEEIDGYDETLYPVDYNNIGIIRDDDILTTLVLPMAKDVFATCLMDCCHSGTVLDLPHVFKADDLQNEEVDEDNDETESNKKKNGCCVIS